MKSAYVTLGVPGNAAAQDIEIAFERARLFYTPERLASVEGAVDKFNEVKAAYELLRNPEFRAAHDRKLTAAHSRPPPGGAGYARTVVEEETPGRKLLKAGLWLLAVIFAAGLFIGYKNAEARRQQAALELAMKEQAEKEEERLRLEAQRQEQQRAQQQAQAEADDRRLAQEGRMAGAQASAERARQEYASVSMQRLALQEAQRQEAARRSEEQRSAMEARRRTEADKMRIRDLCYQQYRRPDC